MFIGCTRDLLRQFNAEHLIGFIDGRPGLQPLQQGREPIVRQETIHPRARQPRRCLNANPGAFKGLFGPEGEALYAQIWERYLAAGE